MSKKVFVGISGGIDSAASVLLLKEKGYDVVGVYLYINKPLENIISLKKELGIDIIINDVREEFSSNIIDNFVSAYIAGETPSPCVECNDKIKWQKLRQIALENGGDYWATGHYCQTVKIDNKIYIKKGVDSLKDQSYYLWKLDQDILSGALFPLGSYTKSNVYSFMREKGYTDLVEKPQSMSICFLNKLSVAEFLRQNIKSDILQKGNIVNEKGDIIGSHMGYPLYTIAQKKGMGLPKGYCVSKIIPKQNKLIVAHRDSLNTTVLIIKNWKFVDIDMIINNPKLTVIVRGVGENPEGEVVVEILSDTLAKVKLSSPAWAVANGQPVVFYIEDVVVGGGYCVI